MCKMQNAGQGEGWLPVKNSQNCVSSSFSHCVQKSRFCPNLVVHSAGLQIRIRSVPRLFHRFRQCFGSLFTESGSRHFAVSGPVSRLLLNPDPEQGFFWQR
jgi:hypothetical protein